MRDKNYLFLYMTPITEGGIGDTVSTQDWGCGPSGLFANAEYPLQLPSGFLRPEPITLDSKELRLFGTVARYGRRKDKLLWCSLTSEIPEFIQSRVTRAPTKRQRSIPTNNIKEGRCSV